MVYLFGLIGFIGGFVIGLFLINLFLQDRSRRELLNDKSLGRTYGVAVWAMAGIGAYTGVFVHGRYFSG